MNIQNILISFLSIILIFSCEQVGDSLRLPGEDPSDIIYYELNNDYLAPESKEFIESNFPSENVNSSFILIGKNTYGFEADLTNDKSLSFDEDGVFKFDREHPFIKEKYIKGKYGRGNGEDKDEDEGRDEGEEKDKDEDKDKDEGKDRERCFEYVMPYTMIMPDSSTITISEEGDREQIKNWYDENSKEEKRPKVQFPVDIIFLSEEEDKEEVLTLTSSDDLKEVMELCFEGEGKEGERCFEYVMPYTMIMPDSSTITISEEGDREQIKNWYDENSKEEKRPKVQFPVDIIFLSEEEDKEEVLTLTSSDDLKEVMELCYGGEEKKDRKNKDKGKKDWCKKLDLSEIDDCIIEYVNENYPDDKIVHSRTILTKDDVTIHIVKLENKGVLKFGEDCEFID